MARHHHAPAVTRRAQTRLGLLLALPALIMTVVFFLFPMGSALYFSVVDFDGIDPTPEFVGFANYTEMFTDPEVWHALSNNVIWIVIGTAAPMVIGLLIAVLIWSVQRGSVIYRLAFFLPFILPGVVIGIVWTWIYDPANGWLNRALGAIGLESLQRGWLGDPSLALYAVLATAIWAYSVFDIVFIMTGGGPADASNVLGTYSYTQAFQLSRIGYGTTLALLITVLSVPFAVALNRLQRRMALQETGV